MSMQAELVASHTWQEERAIRAIREVISHDVSLQDHTSDLDVAIEEGAVVLRGQIPADLTALLVPSVRQAGVLYRVRNEVEPA